ncbi:hypothetical protein FACS1894191_5940 [Clostridia bacterium]|nr:hypothetical protein FACS1894191_5940 [Clostridia bacterium]
MNISITKHTGGRKVLAIVLTAVMAFGLLSTAAPITAYAANSDYVLDISTLAAITEHTYTTFAGWEYNPTSSSPSIWLNDDVTITGTASLDDTLFIYSNGKTITLNNVNLTSSDNPAVYFNDNATLILVGDSSITSTQEGGAGIGGSAYTTSGEGTLDDSGAPITNAATPNIGTQPIGANYTVGNTATALTVAATVSDSGTLTYQWYSNYTNDTDTPTTLSTGSSYTPSTATLGTTYYYCVVTNTNSGVNGTTTATATSNIVAVKVSVAGASDDYVIDIEDLGDENITSFAGWEYALNTGTPTIILKGNVTITGIANRDDTLNIYSYGKTITLNNMNLTSSDDGAVLFRDVANLVLVGTSSITSTNEGGRGIFVSGTTLTVGGDGTLNTTGGLAGLTANQGGNFTMNSGTVNASGSGSSGGGITFADGAVTVNGGVLNMESPRFGFSSGNNTGLFINGGTVMVRGDAAALTAAPVLTAVASTHKVTYNTANSPTGGTTVNPASGYTHVSTYKYVKIEPISGGGDTTAPTLSAVNFVERTSNTAGKITVTSNEAGTVYYKAVADGTSVTQPTVTTDLSSWTSAGAIVASAATQYSVTLSAGAQDVYVVAVDTAGNISLQSKVDFAAYTAPTYAVSIATNGVAQNGVTATGAISPSGNQAAGANITVTITLTGTATAAGTHTVGLTSSAAGTITAPASVTKTVTAGQAMTAGDTFGFTFAMPASAVSDLVVTHTFSAAPTITTTTLVGGTVGTTYSQALAATGDATITWTLDSGTLPVGLTLSSGGLISGTPTTAGTSTFTVKASNGVNPDATKQLSITIEAATPSGTAPTITTTALAGGTVGTAYSQALAATGDATITWTLDSGTLPVGLTLSSGGVISGTPTTAETATFTVKASNGVNPDATKQLSITIEAATPSGTAPTITTNALANGTVNTVYSETLTATGDATITWSVTAGSLPSGLTLSSGGVISGTPTAAGAAAFTVQATNSTGNNTKQLSLVINPAPPPIVGIATPTVTSDDPISLDLNGVTTAYITVNLGESGLPGDVLAGQANISVSGGAAIATPASLTADGNITVTAASVGTATISVVFSGGDITDTSYDSTITVNVTDSYTPPSTYTITASAGANGSISPSGAVTVNEGDSQAFTITPNSGYHISAVTVDGGNVGTGSTYTFNNVTGNHSISSVCSLRSM